MEDHEHRAVAVATFNRCWELLDLDALSDSEQEELLRVAFTSRYHWSFVGGAEQWVVGDWMISRAAAAAHDPALALRFARLAHDAAADLAGPDWLHASTAEGMARAYAASGDAAKRDEWIAEALARTPTIGDDEDRALIESQVATVPHARPTPLA